MVILLLSLALAQEHPTSGQACGHCHDDPHAGTAPETCASCHLPEGWSPTTFTVARHASAAFPLEGAHTGVACRQCHVGGALSGQPTECAGCHVDRHRGLLGDTCTDCHSVHGFGPVEGFDHARSGFTVAGAHTSVGCASCHDGAHGDALRSGAGGDCVTCHAPGHGDLGACGECHADAHDDFFAARAPRVFDHRTTGFPLERRHAAQPCAACHPAGEASPETRCASCHTDPHAGQLGARCDDCHRPDRWRLARFDHDLAGWALRGRHFVTPCADCHTSQRWIGLPTACWDCHALDAAAAPASIPAHGFARTDCGDCHGQWSW